MKEGVEIILISFPYFTVIYLHGEGLVLGKGGDVSISDMTENVF